MRSALVLLAMLSALLFVPAVSGAPAPERTCDDEYNCEEPLPPPPPPPSTGSTSTSCSGVVVLYEHTGYGGACKSFGVGSYTYVGNDFNDRASSVRVAAGYAVTLFVHANYEGGWWTTYSSDAPWGWSGVGNDAVSSIVVQSNATNTDYSSGAFVSNGLVEPLVLASSSGCATVGDAVKYGTPLRTHWVWKVARYFCWSGGKLTRTDPLQIVPMINQPPIPWRWTQSWDYTTTSQTGYVNAGAGVGYITAWTRVDGRFVYSVVRVGTNSQYPWVRIDLRADGTATCTSNVKSTAHACARF